MIGPGLYGVVGRAKAGHPGFDYSPAMKAKGGEWSYADLFHFLKQPAVFVPGTKMAFAGLPRTQDRIDLIAFLRMQAASPAPLPPPQPATAETAPAEGAPAAEGVERAEPTPAADHPDR
jgi:cytochrome c